LLTDLRRPNEIQFLDGEQLVSAKQFGKAISVNFLSFESIASNEQGERGVQTPVNRNN